MRVTSILRAATALLTVFAAGIANAQGADRAQKAAAAQWTPAERKKGYVVFRHHTLDILRPSHVPTREIIADQVSCALAQGEYESLQLGVHAVAGDLKDVRLEVDSELAVKVYRQGKAPVHGYSPQVLLDRGHTVEKVAKGNSAGFWLTLYADPDTRPGVHRGAISIKPSDRPVTRLELQVRVRPFALQLPRILVDW